MSDMLFRNHFIARRLTLGVGPIHVVSNVVVIVFPSHCSRMIRSVRQEGSLIFNCCAFGRCSSLEWRSDWNTCRHFSKSAQVGCRQRVKNVKTLSGHGSLRLVVFGAFTSHHQWPSVTVVQSPTRKETSYSDRRCWCSYILFIIIIVGILVLYIYIYIYIYNKTSIKRNILTIKQNTGVLINP